MKAVPPRKLSLIKKLNVIESRRLSIQGIIWASRENPMAMRRISVILHWLKEVRTYILQDDEGIGYKLNLFKANFV